MEDMISTKLIFFPDIKIFVYAHLKSNSILIKLNIPPQHRAYLAKMQPIWDAEKAAAAAKANRENMVSVFDKNVLLLAVGFHLQNCMPLYLGIILIGIL